MKDIVLILDNIRSAHNVGAILRSADVFGVSELICCGITPYPAIREDKRLPYIASKATKMIAKTALGAEYTVACTYSDSTKDAIMAAKRKVKQIYALEQSPGSKILGTFKPGFPLALVVGNEVDGVRKEILDLCDEIIEIRQFGNKESLNVSVATGIALYGLVQ